VQYERKKKSPKKYFKKISFGVQRRFLNFYEDKRIKIKAIELADDYL
jgi:hypothetical protein